jgi:CheY-like chemotaxis protein/anti-sigma regulatory factor (Ser/Thr protein kinase)
MADHLRLKQVLLNLLSNGIKYNNPGGAVSIQVVPKNGWHQIVVKDTGFGIEESDLNVLIEPFNRHGAEALNIEGTGIGLTITKRLVEVMEGTLTFESELGVGSTFTVEVPMAEVTPEILADQSVSQDAASESQSKRREETILYVEDNHVNVKLVQKILRRCPDIRLLIANTGSEGVELALAELPSLILMDINLPDISGYEAVRQIKANEAAAKIPIVGVSADAMPDVVKKSAEKGLDDYITKPFMIERLMDVVAETLPNLGLSEPGTGGAELPR